MIRTCSVGVSVTAALLDMDRDDSYSSISLFFTGACVLQVSNFDGNVKSKEEALRFIGVIVMDYIHAE